MGTKKHLFAVIGVLTAGAAVRPACAADTEKTPQDQADQSQKLEIVVVTAQKRVERAIDVPISLTAFNSEQLAARGILDLSRLASFTPGLEVTPDPGGGAGIIVRGVTTGVGGVGVDPSVGVYEDGVYVSRDFVALQSYLDVDRAEVLRGPQGTLYGRNTTGGAYNIYHKLPTNDLEAGVSAEYASYDSGGWKQRYEGFISGPIVSDVVAARVAVARDTAADFTKNLFTGSRAPESSTQGIASLRIRPNDSLTIVLRGDILNQNGRVGSNFHVIVPGTLNATADIPNDPYQYRSDFPGNDDYLRNRGWSADIAWSLPGGYQVKSITGGRDIRINTQYDSDGTELPLYTAVLNDQSRTISQEFQFLSPTGGRVEWIAGLFYYHENAHDLTTTGGPYNYGPFFVTTAAGDYLYSGVTGKYLSLKIPFDYRGVFDSTNVTDSYAGFGQLRFNFTDRLQGTIGLRYTQERRTFDGSAGTSFVSEGSSGVYGYNPATACQALIAANPVTSPAGITTADAQAACEADVTSDLADYSSTSIENRSSRTLRFSNTSGRAVLDYHFDADTHVYASVTQGFKSGGFNSYDTDAAYSGSQPGQPGVPVIAFQPPFGPEKLISYEAGVKGSLFGQRMSYSFDYWYYNWSNIQAQVYNYTKATSTVTNDAKARAQGVELDLLARPWAGGSIDFNGGYIDGKYTHFGSTITDVVTGVDNQDFTGTGLPGTPKWKFNLGIQHTAELGAWGDITPRMEYQHRSSAFWVFTRDPTALSGGYDLYNFRLMYRTRNLKYSADLYVENLTNKYYDYYRYGTSTTGVVGIVAPPRTLGVRIKADL